uniref:ARHGAP39 protein n=1 Tax=Fopius arisanus TaxID=64838 RepID=A0A0C9RSZ3_9HYME
MEWVEIIEPRTKEHMYANLTTGECVWDPPPGVHVKKTDNNQWWELFDQNTSRFYYYNATSQKTVWHRPTDCDIIPLAKLQTLKQNTEPPSCGASGGDSQATESRRKESVSTQTQTTSVGRSSRYDQDNATHLSSGSKPRTSGIGIDSKLSPQSPSPSSRRPHHHHHHHHHHQYNNRHSHRHHDQTSHQPSSSSSARRHHNHSQDSGRSSDSSVSHSRTSLESGAAYRLLESPHRHHQRSNILQPPSTSANRGYSAAGSSSSTGGSVSTLEARSHKSGTLESIKNQKGVPISGEPPPLGLSLSTSTPLFKKKTFGEHPNQRDVRGGNAESERSRNGRESSRGSYGPEPSTSPYRESSMEPRAFRQEMPPYRPPEIAPPHTSKAQSQIDKYGSLIETSNRYHRDRDSYHRDRVNSLEKSNASGYYSAGVHSRNMNKTDVPGNVCGSNIGSIGRRHHGCAGSLSEANVREIYGAMLAERNEASKRGNPHGNVTKQKSLEVSERSRDKERDREKERDEFGRTKCNNLMENSQQALARSYSFVQQQKMQQMRRRERDDDSMHERYLVGQVHDQRHRLGSNTSSSNDSNSSGNSAICDELGGNIEEEVDDRKKRSNGNPSPPASPYYGNLLVDADHLLPLQHYILQQAKLSGFYKFGDPLLAEEGDDSLDEDGGREVDDSGEGGGISGRGEDDSDDQFADDEAASNQGDSSSQEYLEDHYADLGNYDTAGLATYYNTAETLTRSQAASSAQATLPSTAPLAPSLTPQQTSTIPSSHPEIRETSAVGSTRPISLPASNVFTSLVKSYDIADGDDHRRDDSTSGGDIEKYAQDNLNLNCGRPKGLRLLFRKKFSVRDILSWTKDPIPRPMLNVVEGEKLLKREACNLFRLVQVYMGDRKANVGMTLDGVATEIVNTVFSKPPLRDELYLQICRQTTENPRKESLRRGWELMAVCLAFVPPSATFEPCLEGYMNRHRDPNFQFPEVAKWPIHVQVSHYATVACRRLQRIGAHGKRQPRKATIEDIDQARLQIFRASMFGATLSEVMALQRDRFPQRDLPWVQTTLTRQVLVRGGTLTEGIFRVSADADEVSALKSCLDRFEDGGSLAASQDAHAPASLLKLWVRELYEPLIPDSFYAECVSMRHDESEASAAGAAAIIDRLPDLNRRVLCHLMRFLQIFARSEVVARTKMDANNLAMVMAPNILRCTSEDPRVILENARKEMAFVRILIESLDTAWVDNLH